MFFIDQKEGQFRKTVNRTDWRPFLNFFLDNTIFQVKSAQKITDDVFFLIFGEHHFRGAKSGQKHEVSKKKKKKK